MCKHYGTVLPDNHRHYIASTQHDNCVLCLVEAEGPMTLERIGSYFGVTKECISQIEKAALRKLKDRLDLDLEDLLPAPVQSFTPKTVWFHGKSSIVNYLDVQSLFSTDDPIDPYSWRHKACIAK